MTEAAIQRAILLALGALPGVQVWRTPAVCCYLPDGRGGYRPVWPLPPGWPDLTCIAYGCALAIEVKAPSMRRRDGTARLRPSQQAMRVVWVRLILKRTVKPGEKVFVHWCSTLI